MGYVIGAILALILLALLLPMLIAGIMFFTPALAALLSYWVAIRLTEVFGLPEELALVVPVVVFVAMVRYMRERARQRAEAMGEAFFGPNGMPQSPRDVGPFGPMAGSADDDVIIDAEFVDRTDERPN